MNPPKQQSTWHPIFLLFARAAIYSTGSIYPLGKLGTEATNYNKIL